MTLTNAAKVQAIRKSRSHSVAGDRDSLEVGDQYLLEGVGANVCGLHFCPPYAG